MAGETDEMMPLTENRGIGGSAHSSEIALPELIDAFGPTQEVAFGNHARSRTETL
jgi:hypothetical protein